MADNTDDLISSVVDLGSFYNDTPQTPENRSVNVGEPLMADVWNGNFYTLSKGLADLVNAVRQSGTEYTWNNLNKWKEQLQTDLQHINPQYIHIVEKEDAEGASGSQLTIGEMDGEKAQIKSIGSGSDQNKQLTISEGTLTYNNTSNNYTIKVGNISNNSDGIAITSGSLDRVIYTTQSGQTTTIQTKKNFEDYFGSYFSFSAVASAWQIVSTNIVLNSETAINNFFDIVNNSSNYVLQCTTKQGSNGDLMQVRWYGTKILAYGGYGTRNSIGNYQLFKRVYLNDEINNTNKYTLFLTYIKAQEETN